MWHSLRVDASPSPDLCGTGGWVPSAILGLRLWAYPKKFPRRILSAHEYMKIYYAKWLEVY
jgi:hypothetical protein